MPRGARLRPWQGRAFGRALLCLALASANAAAQRAGAAASSQAPDPKAIESQRQGAADKQIAAALRKLELARATHGPRHPDTLASMNNLAVLYQGQGRYGEAEPLLREALRLSREALGPRHPTTLASMNNLAVLYQGQGRYGEAVNLRRFGGHPKARFELEVFDGEAGSRVAGVKAAVLHGGV